MRGPRRRSRPTVSEHGGDSHAGTSAGQRLQVWRMTMLLILTHLACFLGGVVAALIGFCISWVVRFIGEADDEFDDDDYSYDPYGV